MAFTRSFEGYRPPRRYDGEPFISAAIREAADEAGPYSTIDTITLDPDTDPAAPATRNLTTNDATLEAGWYIVQWVDGEGSTFDADPLYYPAHGAGWGFATTADVATRLGRELTEAEAESTTAIIASVTSQIAAALDLTDDWAETLEPVPALFTAMCVDKAVAALTNPSGVTSQTLGAFSVSYAGAAVGGGVVLTDADERRVRAAWWGGAGSSRATSIADDVLAFADGTLDDPLP